MEDCCAVCAEPLEWVGYGPCGHRDVCSKCIARLRFVLCDKQCCICKQECPSVFVTKALGDYTKSVDFETIAERKDLWYESCIQAYFDDEHQHKMVKAMCRLSCSICERAENPGKEFMKKGHVFRNLDLLRRHLHYVHKTEMCGLCLEGRKVFISEQKLYSKKQLERHFLNGDADIDRNDEDGGGFTGHPLCNFCHTRFYGDNELYQHMSTDHYTCHICRRLRPEQHDYFRNYDDLESHFCHEHALCEHPDCLAQKFVVFNNDAELKRHNALVHGGNMSRAQRNAALQIPVSFQYRRPGPSVRGGRPFRRRESHLSEEESIGSYSVPESTRNVSLPVQVNNTDEFPHFQNTETAVSVSTVGNVASSSVTEPSRYLAAVSGAGPSSLRDSAFPPLSGFENLPQKGKQPAFPPLPGSESLAQKGKQPAFPLLPGSENLAQKGKQAEFPALPVSENLPQRGKQSVFSPLPGSDNLSQRPAFPPLPVSENLPQKGKQPMRRSAHSMASLIGGGDQRGPKERRQNTPFGGSHVNMSSQSDQWPQVSANPRSHSDTEVVGHFSRAARVEVDSKVSNVSVGKTEFSMPLNLEELRVANKALIESIRTDLQGDEERFNEFKVISAQFKSGEMDATVYLHRIEQSGLLHIVPELARLCPDVKKKSDLLDAFKRNTGADSRGIISAAGMTSSSQGQGPGESIIESTGSDVGELRLTDRGGGSRKENEVEVLSRDGYRDMKGKKPIFGARNGSLLLEKPAKVLVKSRNHLNQSSSSPNVLTHVEGSWTCNVCTLEMHDGSTHCIACGNPYTSSTNTNIEVRSKEKNKKKKAVKLRLGDGSVAMHLETRKKAWGGTGDDVNEN